MMDEAQAEKLLFGTVSRICLAFERVAAALEAIAAAQTKAAAAAKVPGPGPASAP